MGLGISLMLLFSSVQIHAQFSQLYGNSSNNFFNRVIPDGQDFYLLGRDDGKATVSRINSAGLLSWTRVLDIPSRWTDGGLILANGNLIVVGSTLPVDSSNHSLLGEITRQGVFNCLKTLEVPGPETLSRIDRNGDGTFSIVGSQTFPGSPQDVFVLNVSPGCIINSKKLIGSPGIDNFQNDIEVLCNGDYLLAGDQDGRAVMFELTPSGQYLTGTQNPFNYTYRDIANASNCDILAVANSLGSDPPIIQRFDADWLPLWEATLAGLQTLNKIVEDGDGNILVVGQAIIGGVSRAVIVKIDDTNGSPTLSWGGGRFIGNNEIDYLAGSIAIPNSGGIVIIDGREGNPNGFGFPDAFMAYTDGDLTSGCTDDLTLDIVIQSTLFEGPIVDIFNYDVPPETMVTYSSMVWEQRDACNSDTCHADFSYEIDCGVVSFNDQSVIPNTPSWNWTFPGGSPSSSTAQNPIVTYPDCGVYEVCLTVSGTNQLSSCEITTCKSISILDTTPPVITCPGNITVTSTETSSGYSTVNGLEWLTATDACGVSSIQYSVSGATSATGFEDASGTMFNEGLSTVIYTARDECGNSSSCSFTVTVTCASECPGSIITNSDFSIGTVTGPMPQGMVTDWKRGYGTPIVSNALGCGNNGFIQLTGTKTSGDAIYQHLGTPIKKGEVYEMSVCVRVTQPCILPGTCVDYVKIRTMAFNNALPNTGVHPLPNSDLAIIDVSGRIALCDDWTTFVFHRWRAPKDFDNIAITVENSENPVFGKISVADIDNICFSKVNDSIPCYLAQLDSLGNPIPPFGQIDPNCLVLEDSVDIYMGAVNDIYAYCNPAPDNLDTWYELCKDSCESIGGELPIELDDFINTDSINFYMMDSLGVSASVFADKLNSFQDSLVLAHSNTNLVDSIMALGALNFDCRTLPPQGSPPRDTSSPFNGMDIVFVHGLRTTPLQERIFLQTSGSQTEWPIARNEFYTGYWKKGAYEYWNDHTDMYLHTTVDPVSFAVTRTGSYSNRYIVVSHPATQNFVFGAHSVLEQIANAMTAGVGVINCDSTETRPSNTFGHNGFIIISHSDGAPLTDIVLTTSNLSKFPPVNMLLGDVSFIADRCLLHVAIQGAFGGSNYASMILMAATPSFQFVQPLSVPFLGTNINGPVPWLFTSELLDLAIMRPLWGNILNQVPVCVLTLAGGHPTDYGFDIGGSIEKPISYLVKHTVHQGFDDGVLSMDSQSANPDPRLYYPNVFDPKSFIKLFDMGIARERAIRYYLDQKIDPGGNKSGYASSACIPWLSPTGMVQPVENAQIPGVPGFDALKRYHNHYSFIQSAADHYQGAAGAYPNFPDYEKTYDIGSRNFEESRVVTSSDVYSRCWVNPSKLTQVEYIRGKSITFRILKKSYTRWIWKRKYHLLEDYDQKNQLDYLYESVLK